ncbi:MAG: hypothetical protein R2857_02390 [Vampirovibrionales bacterium]
MTATPPTNAWALIKPPEQSVPTAFRKCSGKPNQAVLYAGAPHQARSSHPYGTAFHDPTDHKPLNDGLLHAANGARAFMGAAGLEVPDEALNALVIDNDTAQLHGIYYVVGTYTPKTMVIHPRPTARLPNPLRRPNPRIDPSGTWMPLGLK